MISAMPAPTTDAVKTIAFGIFFWNADSRTTPMAMPVPSAVSRRPKPVGPEPSTSSANTGPSGTIMPPPIKPGAESEHDGADLRVDEDEVPALFEVVHHRADADLAGRARASRFGFVRGSVAIINAERKNVMTSTPIASVSRLTSRNPRPGTSVSPPATAVSTANTKLAIGNVPYAATSESEFAVVS